MFLLIPSTRSVPGISFSSLHSIMFLLIQGGNTIGVGSDSNFTFHYVSINTLIRLYALSGKNSLHSIMFLLIQALRA